MQTKKGKKGHILIGKYSRKDSCQARMVHEKGWRQDIDRATEDQGQVKELH